MLGSVQEEIFESDFEVECTLPSRCGTDMDLDVDLDTTPQPGIVKSYTLFSGLIANEQATVGQAARGYSKESTMERFMRLKLELTELTEDLQSQDLAALNDASSIWALLQTETKQMYNELSSLSLKKVEFETSLHDRFIEDMIQHTESSLSVPSPNTIATDGSLNLSGRDILKLDQRLHCLETLLGVHSNLSDHGGLLRSSFASHGTKSYPLLRVIQGLEDRIALLDTSTLEIFRHRFITLKTEIETLYSKPMTGPTDQVIKALEATARVEEVLAGIQKIEGIADEIPILLTRMKTLENIHWNATMFSARLQELETDMQVIAQEVHGNNDVLAELKTGLKENLTMMQENMKIVENRLATANV
jgi:hypothetical protein